MDKSKIFIALTILSILVAFVFKVCTDKPKKIPILSKMPDKIEFAESIINKIQNEIQDTIDNLSYIGLDTLYNNFPNIANKIDSNTIKIIHYHEIRNKRKNWIDDYFYILGKNCIYENCQEGILWMYAFNGELFRMCTDEYPFTCIHNVSRYRINKKKGIEYNLKIIRDPITYHDVRILNVPSPILDSLKACIHFHRLKFDDWKTSN